MFSLIALFIAARQQVADVRAVATPMPRIAANDRQNERNRLAA